jgi:hypothetical protein
MKVLTLISSSNSGQVISSPSKAISNLLSCFKVAFLKRRNQAVGTLTDLPSDKSAVSTSLLHFKPVIAGNFGLIIGTGAWLIRFSVFKLILFIIIYFSFYLLFTFLKTVCD